MKFNRYLSSRVTGVMSVTVMALFPLSVFGQQVEPVSSQIIQFSSSENLPANNAAGILADRLKLAKTDELRSVYIEHPGDGLEVQRFNQYFRGIPVVHGTYTLTSKNGVASFAFGKYYPVAPSTGIIPKMDEATAFAKATSYIHAEKYDWEDAGGSLPKGSLALMEDLRDSEGDGVLHLAYAFDIYALEPLSRTKVYVDAQDGTILYTDAILKHVNATGASLYSDTVSIIAGRINATKYYLHDSTRGLGIFTYNLNHLTNVNSAIQDSSSTNFFVKDPAVDAHWGAEKVYDYWKNKHNRLSWNGTNGVLKSYVHYSNNYNNAMWNGSAMVYGDGSGAASGGFDPLTALDVCGHEIGHGVCQSTANLQYSRESGAMNEGFSDIWGAVIENYGDPHEIDAVAKDNWLIGEEIGRTLRSMRDPKLYDQPNCYNGAFWVCTVTGTCPAGGDNYGVHTNSGVLNYWFYLLTTGGKGTNDLNNAYKVIGVGMDTSAKIAYATELALTSTSNYDNCRAASIAAATTLYGSCSPTVEAVTRAWFAVGVGADYVPPCTPQVSFTSPTTNFTESANSNSCRPNRVVSVPVSLNGPALSGGNAVVTASVTGGTAVPGVDFDLTKASETFTVGGAVTGSIDITIYDNGVIGANKYIDLSFSLGGTSNATKASVMDSTRVIIINDDVVPDLGSLEQHQLLTNNIVGDTSSPFKSKSFAAHNQYIYRADELRAAGIRPNTPITSLNLFVTSKNSTQPFAGYNIGFANTTQSSLANGFISSGFTTVYSGNLTTTTGANLIIFTTPFLWNGVDNIAMEVCFSNANGSPANDRVQSQASHYNLTAYATGTGSGCSLPFTTNKLVGSRPIILFTQDVPPTPIETLVSSTRTWNMKSQQQIYFYNVVNKRLIAAVINPDDSLGCVTTTVAVSGNGFAPAISGGGQRSIKEFQIATTIALAPGSSCEGILYMNLAELAGKDPTSLRIVQSTSTNDAAMHPGNTNIVSPSSLVFGADYVGFRGNFRNFGRFFLLEGNLALGVNSPAGKTSELWSGLNPFTDAPVLNWNLTAPEKVTIKLYDVTGKLLFDRQQTLDAGRHRTMIKGNTDLVPGTYVLQVVRPSEVFTKQLTKQ